MAKREPGLTAGLQGAQSPAAWHDAAELTHASSEGKRGSGPGERKHRGTL